MNFESILECDRSSSDEFWINKVVAIWVLQKCSLKQFHDGGCIHRIWACGQRG